MKNSIFKLPGLIGSLLILTMVGCEKDLEQYSGKDYVYFTNDITKDSLNYCFGLAGKLDADTLGIEVNISGNVADFDREYVVIVSEQSVAKLEEDFTILNPIFHKQQTTDTLWIVVKNSEKLKSKNILLQLDLVANEHFELCFPKQNSTKIYLTDIVERPDWWDENQEQEGLGSYSEKKYRLFIRSCQVTDFGTMEYPERRDAILRFKRYLENEAEKGNTILDENEQPMQVAIYG